MSDDKIDLIEGVLLGPDGVQRIPIAAHIGADPFGWGRGIGYTTLEPIMVQDGSVLTFRHAVRLCGCGGVEGLCGC